MSGVDFLKFIFNYFYKYNFTASPPKSLIGLYKKRLKVLSSDMDSAEIRFIR